MEFWRTDEIAPIVLIVLFELMVLGLINYTIQLHDANLMPVVECGCTQSRRGSRQDWPEYCLFILAWFPPIPSFVTSAPDWPREVHYAAGSGAFVFHSHPSRSRQDPAQRAKLPGEIAKGMRTTPIPPSRRGLPRLRLP